MTEDPDSLHCISLLFGMSEKTSNSVRMDKQRIMGPGNSDYGRVNVADRFSSSSDFSRSSGGMVTNAQRSHLIRTQ